MVDPQHTYAGRTQVRVSARAPFRLRGREGRDPLVMMWRHSPSSSCRGGALSSLVTTTLPAAFPEVPVGALPDGLPPVTVLSGPRLCEEGGAHRPQDTSTFQSSSNLQEQARRFISSEFLFAQQPVAEHGSPCTAAISRRSDHHSELSVADSGGHPRGLDSQQSQERTGNIFPTSKTGIRCRVLPRRKLVQQPWKPSTAGIGGTMMKSRLCPPPPLGSLGSDTGPSERPTFQQLQSWKWG